VLICLDMGKSLCQDKLNKLCDAVVDDLEPYAECLKLARESGKRVKRNEWTNLSVPP